MSPDAFIEEEEAIDFAVTHLLKAFFSSGMGGRMTEVCVCGVGRNMFGPDWMEKQLKWLFKRQLHVYYTDKKPWMWMFRQITVHMCLLESAQVRVVFV